MKIILPSFYNSYQQNKKIIENFMYYKDFQGISGSFPFSIFNGGYNNNKYSQLALAHDIINSIHSYGAIGGFTVIDFGNLCLIESDFKNCFNKVVLEEYSKSKNIFFSVASIKLAEYLVSTYPDIQLILHQNYTNFHTEEEVQNVINLYKKNLKYIIITPNNECSHIEDIQKIYWIPFTLCYCCPQYYKCIKIDNNQTLNYSTFSQFNDCSSKKYVNLQYLKTLILHANTITNCIIFDDLLIEDEEIVYEQIFNILNEEDI